MLKFFTGSIERKLMIPFFILIIIAVLAVGAVSYWNAYVNYKKVQEQKIEESASQIKYHYRNLLEQVKSGYIQETVAQERLLQYIHDFYPVNVKIFSNDSTMLNYVIREHEEESTFAELLFSEYKLNEWGWTLHISTIVNPFSDFFTAIEKYTVIVMVITSIALIELTIILSSHLSKPIIRLANYCENINQGNEVKPIISNRKDEIGVLTNTFSNMIQSLKKNEKDLRYMQHLNEQILAGAAMGIFAVIHGDKKQFYMNNAAGNIIGDGKNLISQDKLLLISDQVWQMKKEFNDIIRIDDRVIELKVNCLGEGLGVLCILQDITERDAFIREMERIDRLASLGELAAGMAHEIRNPLTGIKTSGQVLLRKYGDDQNAHGLVERIIREIDRLNDLIKNLLQFARPEVSNISEVYILPVINDVLFLISKFIEEKNITVKLNALEQDKFYFDEGHLKQILLNLILNAVKAVDIRGIIEISFKDNQLIIKDNGHGMNSEQLRRCFDPFFTTDPKGTGLGLSVVHRLIEQNNAGIKVFSKLNEGTKFVIEGGFPNEEQNLDSR